MAPEETATTRSTSRPTWAQAEGSPLPLCITWIEQERAFNFAVHSEHAESVTLLLYAATDLITPLRTFRFDFLRNKSGIAVYHAPKSAKLLITHTQCRVRPFPVSIASTHKRFCSILTREECFFPPSSIALWQCEKDQTQGTHHWAC